MNRLITALISSLVFLGTLLMFQPAYAQTIEAPVESSNSVVVPNDSIFTDATCINPTGNLSVVAQPEGIVVEEGHPERNENGDWYVTYIAENGHHFPDGSTEKTVIHPVTEPVNCPENPKFTGPPEEPTGDEIKPTPHFVDPYFEEENTPAPLPNNKPVPSEENNQDTDEDNYTWSPIVNKLLLFSYYYYNF